MPKVSRGAGHASQARDARCQCTAVVGVIPVDGQVDHASIEVSVVLVNRHCRAANVKPIPGSSSRKLSASVPVSLVSPALVRLSVATSGAF